MSQEIIYTSARQGLRPGSSGFCTVASTAGMAKNLAERLESLSGYRHHYAPHESGTHSNPVNYSHVHITVGGRRYHVLSRVCDAGLDYTQRTNKLAHHVALEPQEVAVAVGGPAWVLSAAGFCVTQWEGEPRKLAAGRQPTTSDCLLGKCKAWEKATGDAGWGGVLAESGLTKGRPLSVIFAPATDTLLLVTEAMSLLDEQQRWDVTFSTYFVRLPAGVDCQWRFILDGTQEAAALRRDPHARVVDLCASLGRAESSVLVEMARTGLRAANEITAGPKRVTRVKPMFTGAARQGHSEDPFALAPLGESSGRDIVELPFGSVEIRSASRYQPSMWRGVAIWASLFVLLGSVIIGASFFAANRPPIAGVDPDQGLIESDPPRPQPDDPLPDDTYDPLQSEEAKNLLPRIKEVEAINRQQQTGKKEPAPELPSSDRLPAKKTDSSESRPDPLRAVRELDGVLELPPRSALGSDLKELVKLYVDDASACTLELLTGELIDTSKRELFVQHDADDPTLWEVIYRNESLVNPNSTVGYFQVKDDALAFRWGIGGGDVRLEYCLLSLRVGDEHAQCVLHKPREIPPLKIDVRGNGTIKPAPQRFPMPLDAQAQPPADLIRFDVAFEGYADSVVKNGQGLKLGERCLICLPHPDDDDKALELETSLEQDESTPDRANTVGKLTIFAFPKAEDGNRPRTQINQGKLEHDRKRCAEDRKSNDRKQGRQQADLRKLNRQLDELKPVLERMRAAKEELDKATGEDNISDRQKEVNAKLRNQQAMLVNQKRAEVDATQREMEAVNREIAKLENEEAAIKKQEQWYEEMSQLLDDLRKKGHLQLRVYFTIEGREVDIMRTSCARWGTDSQ